MTRRLRPVVGNVLALGFVAAALALSLSDRVGLGVGAVSRRGHALLYELERAVAVDVLDRSDVPFETDALGHAVLWGLVMVMVGRAFGRRAPLALASAGVFGLSLAVEVGQDLWSVNRTAQLDDAIANLAGIAVAATMLMVSRRGIGLLGPLAQDPRTEVK